MSKIIYRKVRTAPGLKTTDANWEQSAAYYAKAVSTETLSLRDMAKHITSHGSPYTVDVVMGVLEVFRSCCIEQLLESKKVKIEGLGTFYVTIANKKGGEKDLSKFNINSMAVGLRLRFLPETATEESISQREFLKKARFIDVADLANLDETPENEEGGTVIEDEGGQNGSNGDGGSTGSPQGGSGSGSTIPTLTISKTGTGTATVKVGGNAVNSGSQIGAGTEVAIEVTPASGQVPTATLNGTSVSLTNNEGTYTGSFEMPADNATLVINSGSSGAPDDN